MGLFLSTKLWRRIDMQIKTGKCHSVPTISDNGKIELSEKWEWTSGDFSKGESRLVEMKKN